MDKILLDSQMVELFRLLYIGLLAEKTGNCWEVTAHSENLDFKFVCKCGDFARYSKDYDPFNVIRMKADGGLILNLHKDVDAVVYTYRMELMKGVVYKG